MVKKAYEKHAWIILFAVGLVILVLAVLIIALPGLNSYRAGEKWAWYSLWYLPVLFVLLIASGLSAGSVTWPLWLILIVAALFGLLLPFRKFFPKS